MMSESKFTHLGSSKAVLSIYTQEWASFQMVKYIGSVLLSSNLKNIKKCKLGYARYMKATLAWLLLSFLNCRFAKWQAAEVRGQMKRISVNGRPCGATQVHSGILSTAHEELVNSSVRIPQRSIYCFIASRSLEAVADTQGHSSYTSKIALQELCCLLVFLLFLSIKTISKKCFQITRKLNTSTNCKKQVRLKMKYALEI